MRPKYLDHEQPRPGPWIIAIAFAVLLSLLIGIVKSL